jgi:hypothetical protein
MKVKLRSTGHYKTALIEPNGSSWFEVIGLGLGGNLLIKIKAGGTIIGQEFNPSQHNSGTSWKIIKIPAPGSRVTCIEQESYFPICRECVER